MEFTYKICTIIVTQMLVCMLIPPMSDAVLLNGSTEKCEGVVTTFRTLSGCFSDLETKY
jgi:hypothetical protein